MPTTDWPLWHLRVHILKCQGVGLHGFSFPAGAESGEGLHFTEKFIFICNYYKCIEAREGTYQQKVEEELRQNRGTHSPRLPTLFPFPDLNSAAEPQNIDFHYGVTPGWCTHPGRSSDFLLLTPLVHDKCNPCTDQLTMHMHLILELVFIYHYNMLPRVGPGHPSNPLSIYFLIFSPFYFPLSFIGFTYFLLLSIPSFSTRIVPLRFQAGGRRRRPNLVLVSFFVLYFVLSVFLS